MALDDDSIRWCNCSLSISYLVLTCVEWSPVDEFILASASWDGKMKLWDTRWAASNELLWFQMACNRILFWSLIDRNSVRLSACLYVHMSICLSVYLHVCLSICMSACKSVGMSICQSICLSVCLSMYLSVCLSLCPSVSLPISLSVCLSICLPVCLYVCLLIYLSVYLSICLSIFCLFVYLHTCLHIHLFIFLLYHVLSLAPISMQISARCVHCSLFPLRAFPHLTSPALIYDISAQEEQLQRCLAVLWLPARPHGPTWVLHTGDLGHTI